MSKVHKVLLSGIVLCFVVLLMGQSTGPYFSIRVRPVTDGNLIVFDGTSGFFGRDGGAPAGGGTNTLQEVLTKSSDAGGLVVTNLLPEAYGSAWDGKQETPTKDAVYDEMETRVDSAGDTITGALLLDDDASLQMDATADGMADDKYNGITMTGKNAGEAITLWDCVFMQADGKFDQADATTGSGEFPAWGIACNATGDGTNLVVLTSGVVRNEGWTGLTIAGAVYLSETTGGITQTAPSTSGDCIQVVGFAISDSEILFNFNNVWSEVE